MESAESVSLLTAHVATYHGGIAARRRASAGQPRDAKESSSSSSAEGGAAGSGRGAIAVEPSTVSVLKGHEKEVFICSWNPQRDLLASGSGDSTARVWNLQQRGGGSSGAAGAALILKHSAAGETGSKVSFLFSLTKSD